MIICFNNAKLLSQHKVFFYNNNKNIINYDQIVNYTNKPTVSKFQSKRGRKQVCKISGAYSSPPPLFQITRHRFPKAQSAASCRKRMITDYLVPVFISFFLRQFFSLSREVPGRVPAGKAGLWRQKKAHLLAPLSSKFE